MRQRGTPADHWQKGTLVKRHLARFSAVAGVALLLGLVLALQPVTTVFATPSEPTLGLKGLQDLLDVSGPSHTVDGYFKTVVHDDTIKNIPVTIKSVTPTDTNGFPYPMIFIQAYGPDITDAGGSIAAGMSGSPVFVDDGTGDKLIGAVSYGEFGGTNGYGYATPIEAMAGQEAAHPASPARAPVVARYGKIKLQALRAFSVMGLKPGSRAYRAFVKKMAGKNMKVVPSGGAFRAYDPGFSTAFDGGSSLGAFISRGDFLAGGLGTVTYSSPTTLVAFGHPLDYFGTTELYLTNGWVHGIFAIDPGADFSNYGGPFKLISPTALRGVVTQDREFGIEARYGTAGSPLLPSEEAPITSGLTIPSTGQHVTALTYMPTKIIDEPWYSDFAAFAADAMYSKLPIDSVVPAGALTTSTVVLTDGTKSYTVQLHNVWPDTYEDNFDLFAILDGFGAVNDWGLQKVHFKSVDLQTRAQPVPIANIVDVSVPGGLRVGDNTVKVDALMYGVPDTQTADIHLTIPAGTPLAGDLEISAPAGRMPWFYDDMMGMPSSQSGARTTVAEIVAELKASPANNELQVSYSPAGSSRGSVGSLPGGVIIIISGTGTSARTATAKAAPQVPIEASVPTDWFLAGGAAKTSPSLTLRASKRTVSYRGSVMLSGSLQDLTEGEITDETTVTLFSRAAGASSDTTLAELPIDPNSEEGPYFSYPAFGLRKNTVFTVKWPGDDTYLAASTPVTVKVAPVVTLGASAGSLRAGRSVRLTARVIPAQTGAFVAFEWKARSGWRRLKTVALASGGWAHFTWKPTRGTKRVRAHFLGSALNPAAASATRTIVVR
jgi:hypothetical protein